MNLIIIPLIAWVARLIIFFPFITSTIKANSKENREKLPLPIKIMRLHLALAFILQACITTLFFLHINNMFLIHLYIVEEFIMDMLFYRELLKKIHQFKDVPEKRKIFLLAITAFITFAIVNALFITNTTEFPIYLFIIQSVVMIICTTTYNYVRGFYQPEPISTYEIEDFKLYKGPVFWINMGKHIYFIFALPLFILYHTAVQHKQPDMAVLIWSIQNISLIALHIFMGIGFLKFSANTQKVLDIVGRQNKEARAITRKKYINKDLSYMDLIKRYPMQFDIFKQDNPDLIPHSYTIENHKKDFNSLQRQLYIAQAPEMIAFLKAWPSALEDFKNDNPDLFTN